MNKICPVCEGLLQVAEYYGILSPEALEVARPVAKCPTCAWTGRWQDALIEPRIPNPKPAMSYVSIDIETTGLDPATCQILEVGAVFDNWTLPLRELPRFHCYVFHKQIVGQPYALALNVDILRKLANPQPTDTFLRPEEIASEMALWLGNCGWDRSKAITPAGKNFASFDRQFLKRLPDFEKKVQLHHRTLDPAMLFWQSDDEKLPDSKKCYERASKDSKVAHTALEDALDVVWLLRVGIKRLKPCS